MKNPIFDIGCVADLCVDLIMCGDVIPRFRQIEQFVEDYNLELGGSATIFASQICKLGGRPFIIGAVGDDEFGKFILKKLADLKIDTSAITVQQDIKTGLGLALVQKNDRAILTYPGSIDSVEPSDLSTGLLKTCHHWHIASIFLMNNLRNYWEYWLENCRSFNITTSLDPNWDPEENWSGILDLLPLIDVFLPNEVEAKAITGENDILKAGKVLSSQGNLVIIKREKKGAIAFKEKQIWQIQPNEVIPEQVSFVDAIGAGDSFDAGFIRSWQLGWDIYDCMKLAIRCGAACVAGRGGFEKQLTEVVK